jgi:predicted ferric reductase
LVYSGPWLALACHSSGSEAMNSFSHLLMFPIIGLLCVHGTAGLLQYPMLGCWLAFPTLVVLIERLARIASGFHRLPASLEISDPDTVAINVTIPSYRYWPYKAGKYIFLQVPKLSIFQWHPFTISTCIGNENPGSYQNRWRLDVQITRYGQGRAG